METITKEQDHKEVSQIKRKSRKLPKSIRPEEFRELIKMISDKDKYSRIAFLLAYASGLRISEVLRVKKENFLSDGFIFVEESKYGLERKTPKPKGWRDEFFKFLPLMKKSISTDSRKLQRNFKKYSKKANLNPSYTFHSLRHGFATRCLESGMPLNQVQVLLGHSNISTTSIYVKANPKDALKSYEELF